MNFRELSYPQLQRECKLRNLPAKGKVLKLIESLEHYELSKKKDDPIIEISADLDGYLSSFDVFGIDTSDIKPVNEPIINEVNHTQVTKSKVYIAKPIKQDTVSTAAIKYFDLEQAYSANGYKCINDGTNYYGKEATNILTGIFQMYPILEQYVNDICSGKRISIMFALAKELVETKKIITKGRNNTPATVQISSPKVRTIYVSNDKGTDLGLPSEKRSPYKSNLKHGIIDHKHAIKIYVGDKLVYPVGGSKVTVLPSEAYTKNNKSKEHKSNSGYTKSKNTKNKRNTGVKLTSSIQQKINTNLMGNLFKLPNHDYKMQVEINHNGVLYLNQYIKTEKIQVSIGKIGELDSSGRWQIEYATNYKLASNQVIDRHIQMIIGKGIKHDTNFLKTQSTINEPPTQQLSRRAMKAIKKQQSNTLVINSDTNLVSLVKK
jgi:hypothetical protein